MAKKVGKAVRSAKARGVSPVIAGRVPASLHRQIAQAAKLSGRSMSEEMSFRVASSFERLGLIGEILSLVYGPDMGKLLAAAHVHGGILELRRSEDREVIRTLMNRVIDQIPVKGENS